MGYFTISQTSSNKLIILDIDEIIEDGCVSGNSSLWYDTDTTFKMGKDGGGWQWRAYVEWDISEIPDDATIQKMYLWYNGSSNTVDCKVLDCLAVRPSTYHGYSGASLFNYLDDGDLYASPSGFPVASTNQLITLGSSSYAEACVDLTARLGYAWFAIAILSTSEESTLLSYINSEDNSSSSPAPTLIILYNFSYSVTLSQPFEMSKNVERSVKTYLFKEGKSASKDVGSGGITVVLSGTESDNEAESKMDDINSMKDNGDAITLSGFDDDRINDEWLIKNFTYSKKEGYDSNLFDWELTLIKETIEVY